MIVNEFHQSRIDDGENRICHNILKCRPILRDLARKVSFKDKCERRTNGIVSLRRNEKLWTNVYVIVLKPSSTTGKHKWCLELEKTRKKLVVATIKITFV